MPLYTYFVVYKDETHVAQARHSNFTGFVSSWSTDLPQNALPSLSPKLRGELAKKAYQGTFAEVPNRNNVWSKVIEVGDEEFRIFAAQTVP